MAFWLGAPPLREAVQRGLAKPGASAQRWHWQNIIKNFLVIYCYKNKYNEIYYY
jgi:hypothetical protein